MTRITRVEVIDENGRSYVNWKEDNDITLSYQDDGRTLKVFVNTMNPAEEAFKRVYGAYPPTTPSVSNFEDTRWSVFQAGYNASKVTEVEPSMTNCVLLGNPPDGYVTWNEWYNEMGSKGILHNLKISSKDYKPTPQTPEQVNTFAPKELEELVREGMKWCEENPEKSVEDYITPQKWGDGYIILI